MFGGMLSRRDVNTVLHKTLMDKLHCQAYGSEGIVCGLRRGGEQVEVSSRSSCAKRSVATEVRVGSAKES